jgi:hypothetical protein
VPSEGRIFLFLLPFLLLFLLLFLCLWGCERPVRRQKEKEKEERERPTTRLPAGSLCGLPLPARFDGLALGRGCLYRRRGFTYSGRPYAPDAKLREEERHGQP